jgi:hypothetical protein
MKYLFPQAWVVGVRYQARTRPALRPTKPPIQWVPGSLSPGVKQQRLGTDHSPPSSAEIKNSGVIPPTPPNAIMASIVIGWACVAAVNLISVNPGGKFYLCKYSEWGKGNSLRIRILLWYLDAQELLSFPALETGWCRFVSMPATCPVHSHLVTSPTYESRYIVFSFHLSLLSQQNELKCTVN